MANSMIQKIHVAKNQIGISDDNYRDLLSGWTNARTGHPVKSSKEMTFDQHKELLNTFKAKFGWKEEKAIPRGQEGIPKGQERQPRRGRKTKMKFIKIEVPANRPNKFATEAQLKMLAGFWVEFSREKDEKSFNNFICRIAEVSHYSFLQKESVQKVKLAMESFNNFEC